LDGEVGGWARDRNQFVGNQILLAFSLGERVESGKRKKGKVVIIR